MTQISEKSIIHRQDAKEFIEDYWTKRAPGFKSLRREELQSEKMRQWQEEICRHLPVEKPLKILDIGCGAGFFSILLAAKGYNVTGIDLTESMIEEAVALAAEEKSNARFQVMDAEKLSFPDESFDVVVSRNVTWNLLHPEQAYAEWLRVLKTGGLLLNYDAEHGKYHHGDYEKEAVYAHKDVTKEMVEQCHQIYHMLDISIFVFEYYLQHDPHCLGIKLGETGIPMFSALFAYALFRVLWCEALLSHWNDMAVIYNAYNVSFLVSLAILIPAYRRVYQHLHTSKGEGATMPEKYRLA